MVNVFMRLTNINGEPEEIDLGLLYVDHDANGFMRHIAVEPYEFSDLEPYEAHFGRFDGEIPEVPRDVQIDQDRAFISDFFNQDGYTIDLDSMREGATEILQGPEIKRYDSIVRLAYRLYERAVRGEPAFVGYTDYQRHRRLTIGEILGLTLPLDRRLPVRERREALFDRFRVEAAEKGVTLRRVSLYSENEISAGFPTSLVLDVCTRSDGFPHRVGRVLGVADTGQPLVISDDGELRIGDKLGFFTNLMGCQMELGDSLIVWTDHCQRSQIFQITSVDVLINTESTQKPI